MPASVPTAIASTMSSPTPPRTCRRWPGCSRPTPPGTPGTTRTRRPRPPPPRRDGSAPAPSTRPRGPLDARPDLGRLRHRGDGARGDERHRFDLGTPVPDSASIRRARSSGGSGRSACRPSRGPTSRIVTRFGEWRVVSTAGPARRPASRRTPPRPPPGRRRRRRPPRGVLQLEARRAAAARSRRRSRAWPRGRRPARPADLGGQPGGASASRRREHAVHEPHACASSTARRRPVKISSFARATPHRRASSCVPPPPGTIPTVRLRQAEHGVVGRHDQVAGQRELEPAAQREAEHRRDGRRGRLADGGEHAGACARGSPSSRRRPACFAP